jgi:hypothetical protein
MLDSAIPPIRIDHQQAPSDLWMTAEISLLLSIKRDLRSNYPCLADRASTPRVPVTASGTPEAS